MTIREILREVPSYLLSGLEWAYDALGHFIFLEILDLTIAQLLFILAIIGFVVLVLREELKAIEEDYYFILDERAELSVVYGLNEEEINESVKSRSGIEYVNLNKKYQSISSGGLIFSLILPIKFILMVVPVWILFSAYDYDTSLNLWWWNPILLGILLLYTELKRSALKRAENKAYVRKLHYQKNSIRSQPKN